MGLDKFTSFICKSLNNNAYEELNIQDNIKKIVASHIIFDMNFLLYQEIIEFETEVNNIIKTILCVSFNIDKINDIKNILNAYFSKPYWNYYTKSSNLVKSLNYNNDDLIIKQFINDLNEIKISDNILLEILIYNKIYYSIINIINTFHIIELIEYISLYFDGIPSISKIIEQRKRRIKNYLESNNKKKNYKSYFDNLYNNNNTNINDYLYYDYIKWLNIYKFSIDKSIAPMSNFILNCELFIEKNIKKIFPKIKININSSNINGEADFKIFKEIFMYGNGDYSIHTIDSDLIHLMLIQIVYYKLIDVDININIIKYNSMNNKNNIIQIFDGFLIIKNILNLYNNINNTRTNNYKIIWDLCLIFFSFGNDHLPASVEISSELGLEFFLKTHFSAFNNNNIISFDTTIRLNLKNLALYYSKINETKTQNITKILLQKYFKINIYLNNILIYKYNFNFNEVLIYLKNYIIYKACTLSQNDFNDLDEDDIRKIYLLNLYNIDNINAFINDKNKIIISNIIKKFNFNDNLENILYNLIHNRFNDNNDHNLLLNIIKQVINFDYYYTDDIIKLLDENLDYYENQYNGLKIYSKPYILSNNNYQDINNYIIDKTTLSINKNYPIFYNYNDLDEYFKQINIIDNIEPEEYLKNIYYLVITLFGPMNNFHSDNITFYKKYYVPSLNNMINYINSTNDEQLLLWNKELNNDNINNNYINSNKHYILISPFIDSQIIKDNNLWIDNFEYKNIDINNIINSENI